MHLLATIGPRRCFDDAIVSIVEHPGRGKKGGRPEERLRRMLRGRMEVRYLCLYIRRGNGEQEESWQPNITNMTLVKELDAYLKIELLEETSEEYPQVYKGDAAIALYQDDGYYAIVPMHRPTMFHILAKGAGWA
jgi:hypothetical protein